MSTPSPHRSTHAITINDTVAEKLALQAEVASPVVGVPISRAGDEVLMIIMAADGDPQTDIWHGSLDEESGDVVFDQDYVENDLRVALLQFAAGAARRF